MIKQYTGVFLAVTALDNKEYMRWNEQLCKILGFRSTVEFFGNFAFPTTTTINGRV